MPLIARCSFHATVSPLNILLGYIENLKALKLEPKTLTTQTKKPCEEFLVFINLPTAMASDVTHSKILMSKLDRKNTKQITAISKIPYTDLKIYPSCLKLCEILLEEQEF